MVGSVLTSSATWVAAQLLEITALTDIETRLAMLKLTQVASACRCYRSLSTHLLLL